jgi:hypothetical protein
MEKAALKKLILRRNILNSLTKEKYYVEMSLTNPLQTSLQDKFVHYFN